MAVTFRSHLFEIFHQRLLPGIITLRKVQAMGSGRFCGQFSSYVYSFVIKNYVTSKLQSPRPCSNLLKISLKWRFRHPTVGLSSVDLAI